MLHQGPYITVYIYTECCVTMQVFCGLTESASEATRILTKYELCVKTNSGVSNCKPDEKQKSRKFMTFMALVKKFPFLMAIKFELS